jgi:hypothetical protein
MMNPPTSVAEQRMALNDDVGGPPRPRIRKDGIRDPPRREDFLLVTPSPHRRGPRGNARDPCGGIHPKPTPTIDRASSVESDVMLAAHRTDESTHMRAGP